MSLTKVVPLRVNAPIKEVFTRLKTKISSIPDAEKERITLLINDGMNQCRFLAAWREIDLKMAQLMAMDSEDIEKLLQNCGSAVIFGVTAGDGIVKASADSFAAGECARAAIFDATGSEAVEAAADALEHYLRQYFMRHSRALGRQRFSPGYGDWSLESQKYFFEFLDLNTIGVKLSKELIMAPEKSITAIIGVGHEQN